MSSPAIALAAARLLLRLREAPEPAVIHDELRRLGPVLPVPWLRSLLVTGYRECRQTLRDPDFQLPDAAWRDRTTPGWRDHRSLVDLTSSLLTLNPPRHTLVRAGIAPGLARTALAELRPAVEKFTDGCLDELAAALREGPADLTALLAEPLPARAMCRWLGAPPADASLLARLARRYSVVQELSPTAAQLADADRAAEELKDYFLPLVDSRLRRPGTDQLSGWAGRACASSASSSSSGLTSYDVAVNAAMLFVAGFETTATLITSLARAVIEEPGFADRSRATPGHIPVAVEEIIRRNPSAAVVSRVATRDRLLGGIHVPKDQLVHLLLPAANRDPAAAGQPHLSFGTGVHYCLGAALARLELTTLLPRLLDRFPRLRLAAPPEAPRGLALPHPPRLFVTADQTLPKARPR
ncbi:cytochrome P450 [Streptomyces mayteni]